MNFVGASFGNPSPAGYGCVLRDSFGYVRSVKGGPIGVCDAIFVKLMGLLEGARMLKAKGLKDCIVEGDSSSIIAWERGSQPGSWKVHHFIVEIHYLVGDLGVVLHHLPRAHNDLADNIAKWSAG